MRKHPFYDAVALLARIAVGVVFIAHGWKKVEEGITATGASFEAMGVPLPTAAAVYATFVELLGGVALILGLALPVAGSLLFLDMAGAFAFVHVDQGITAPRGFELVLVLGFAALMFAAGAGGDLTLDHKIARRRADPFDKDDDPPPFLPPEEDPEEPVAKAEPAPTVEEPLPVPKARRQAKPRAPKAPSSPRLAADLTDDVVVATARDKKPE